ncbi:hypothetical protein GCM10011499_20370 [Pelagibacterium lentulum]|uniref:Uncharacterized protein n=1 Tax=Pelagibacterium lentulum TaxID=2029865 RepID=A0A916RBB5_9HYPH|nr:hypothetical protein GCM10011499_20370 [Pelagibacterium lentulum]
MFPAKAWQFHLVFARILGPYGSAWRAGESGVTGLAELIATRDIDFWVEIRTAWLTRNQSGSRDAPGMALLRL